MAHDSHKDGRGFLTGGGEMGKLIRSMDWSKTPLGPPESWPQSLRTTLNLSLASNFPLCFAWGPERVQFYNDGYWPICGAKHPTSMGQDYKECWNSAWPVIGPAFERCMATGEATFLTDTRMFLDRNGYLEETFFTFSFSPIRDETGAVAGVFHPVTETTHLVLAERRLSALRDLTGGTADAKTIDETLALAAKALARHPLDLPFALLYRLDVRGRYATLAGSTGLRPGAPAAPRRLDVEAGERPAWPLAEVSRTGRPVEVNDLVNGLGDLGCGPYPESPQRALVFPICVAGIEYPPAILVVGVSPRRELDQAYRGFYDLLAAALTTAVANAQAYEEEKQRAETLAELDRAKTAFFSNISHEFRTPLTLMIGPLEDVLAKGPQTPLAESREQLTAAHRNSLRLLRLVNALLDFSRIEAGRVQASYEPTDLAALTADLASHFRSACERAGLRLLVDCPPLPEPAYVDRDMWEKIVLNLLSNAFKFTFEGEIELRLRRAGGAVELSVRDTGTGIPESEVPRLFDRFHRVEGARGRTHEGTGIGLALVQELVRLHGGSVRVESVLGNGSTFTVAIPLGKAHLSFERIEAARALPSTAPGSISYVEEALRWLPGATGAAPLPAARPAGTVSPGSEQEPLSGQRPRVLLADDNADMREYVRKLLAPVYEVEVACDGLEALDAARDRPPALVLTDVMMPRLDGFGLLRALRSSPGTRTIPVVMLSARAGEESRVEGLEAGANDYLVKPFSGRELLARVRANLELARTRKEAERAAGREEALREANRRKDDFLAMLAHELRNPLAPLRTAVQILRMQEDTRTVERVREMMDRQVRHLTRLVDDLLDVSRIARGKVSLQRERLDLARLVRTVAGDRQADFKQAGLKFTLDAPEPPLWVMGDATRLTQTLENLLGNAVKFTARGGEVGIRLTADEESRQAVLVIRDTGIGIEPEMLPRLFEAFAQADRSLDRSPGGLGLGLSLVKGLVVLHGGKIEAQSEGVGQGAEFTVRLPKEEELPALGAAASLPSQATKRLRILVVEDNHDAADSLRMLLECLGHEVTVAYTGPDGVAAAGRVRPDAVVCDIGLPGMDGFTVASTLRKDPVTAQARLIAVTGYGQEEDKRRATAAGFNGHLTKPADPGQLLALLEAA